MGFLFLWLSNLSLSRNLFCAAAPATPGDATNISNATNAKYASQRLWLFSANSSSLPDLRGYGFGLLALMSFCLLSSRDFSWVPSQSLGMQDLDFGQEGDVEYGKVEMRINNVVSVGANVVRGSITVVRYAISPGRLDGTEIR